MENNGKSWKIMENHGKTMENPWENHGKTMENPWENPWKIHGKITRVFNGNDLIFPYDFPMDSRGFPWIPATFDKVTEGNFTDMAGWGLCQFGRSTTSIWPSKIVGNMMINMILSFTSISVDYRT
jgi:hypothetical protein